MGNIFSRNLTPRDKLLQYEEKIQHVENELTVLKTNYWSFSNYIYYLFLIIFFSVVVYLMDVNIYLASPAVIVLFVLFHCLSSWLKKRRIARLIGKINMLKKKQVELIKEYKKQNDFASTKKIIEKYEDEESRDSFFKQIQMKKRDTIEKIADYVLDNDPRKLNALICTKCGVHNGLIDPANEKFERFYCYNCKFKNIRILEKKNN